MDYNFLFVGDTFLKTNTSQGYGVDNPFSNSAEQLFNKSQNICINLETTVGEGGVKVAKAYNFQVSPNALSYLTDNHIEICSLANNHSLDFGEEGLKQTVKNLQDFGLSYIGTDTCNLKKLLIGEKQISICSYYGNNKGLARLNKDKIVEDIKKLKHVSDYIFVCLHWGEEYVAYPSPGQQEVAHALIDAGADVIIGHHPHVMQGLEKYKQGLIFYSLGNFNFFVDHPYAKRLIETTKALAVGFYLDQDNRIQYEIIPISINANWQPELINDQAEKEKFYNYFNRVSDKLNGGIKQIFYLAELSPHYFRNHLPSWKKRIKTYGFTHFVKMIEWLLHPAIYKYYFGLFISLFHNKVKY